MRKKVMKRKKWKNSFLDIEALLAILEVFIMLKKQKSVS